MQELLKRSEMDLLRKMHEEDTGLHIDGVSAEWRGDDSRKDHNDCTDPIYYLLRWYYNDKGYQCVMFIEDIANVIHGFVNRALQYQWNCEGEAAAADALVLEKCFGYPLEQLPKVMSYKEKDYIPLFWSKESRSFIKDIGLPPVRDESVSFVSMVSKWRMMIGK